MRLSLKLKWGFFSVLLKKTLNCAFYFTAFSRISVLLEYMHSLNLIGIYRLLVKNNHFYTGTTFSYTHFIILFVGDSATYNIVKGLRSQMTYRHQGAIYLAPIYWKGTQVMNGVTGSNFISLNGRFPNRWPSYNHLETHFSTGRISIER